LAKKGADPPEDRVRTGELGEIVVLEFEAVERDQVPARAQPEQAVAGDRQALDIQPGQTVLETEVVDSEVAERGGLGVSRPRNQPHDEEGESPPRLVRSGGSRCAHGRPFQ
jgi:hypothetical protein